ncbi:hypothetical protein [Shewanella fodinae]|jgi:hypothetical protein|uniref:Uncharacterized protein n=1 Tax=Shewanella fodinae TaxID=552357 RepID=A0A4R2F142_9GAMM|nr:hypothetical protein [Shewanella fodinae]MDN5369588.1 hypothetical protein [Shewanella sp.]TCN77719.1 hypothetical protein EDC91_14420 [Shewanella fodinae]
MEAKLLQMLKSVGPGGVGAVMCVLLWQILTSINVSNANTQELINKLDKRILALEIRGEYVQRPTEQLQRSFKNTRPDSSKNTTF